MENEFLVSIITVTYNAEETLERTIKSVLNQTYKNIEYIIVDGVSTDGTIDIIKKYDNKISKWISEPDVGLYDAMNKGISMASGELIGIINADDFYELDAVEKIVKCAMETGAGVISGNQRHFDSLGHTIDGMGTPIERMWYDMAVYHPTVFVRKSVYNEYGTFDLKYRIDADYELMLRLYVNGVSFEKVDSIISNFYLGGTSVENFSLMIDESRSISIKYADYYRGNENILSLIEERYLFQIAITALQGPADIVGDVLRMWAGNNDIYIWGACKRGKEFMDYLLHFGFKVNAFVDKDAKKRADGYEGMKVIDPSEISEGNIKVYVAMKNIPDYVREEMGQSRFCECKYISWETLQQQIRIVYLQRKYAI